MEGLSALDEKVRLTRQTWDPISNLHPYLILKLTAPTKCSTSNRSTVYTIR